MSLTKDNSRRSGLSFDVFRPIVEFIVNLTVNFSPVPREKNNNENSFFNDISSTNTGSTKEWCFSIRSGQHSISTLVPDNVLSPDDISNPLQYPIQVHFLYPVIPIFTVQVFSSVHQSRKDKMNPASQFKFLCTTNFTEKKKMIDQ